jgi:hypothetical protein
MMRDPNRAKLTSDAVLLRWSGVGLVCHEAVGISVSSGGFKTLPGMARDFVSCERGQLLLMPPSLVEWLPEDHLVWTVLGAVEQMDLDRFREGYRLGGAGRAPYDPAMLG